MGFFIDTESAGIEGGNCQSADNYMEISVRNTLSDAENMALEFLSRVTADTMGPISTDEEMAAALVYSSLINKGYVEFHQKDGLTTYVLTGKKPTPVQ